MSIYRGRASAVVGWVVGRLEYYSGLPCIIPVQSPACLGKARFFVDPKTLEEIKEMKVLSVKQPWAFLIVSGIKNIENRAWFTNYTGPLLIHASKQWDGDAMENIRRLDDGSQTAIRAVCEHFQYVHGAKGNLNLPCMAHRDEFGAIVGKVELYACWHHSVPLTDTRWAERGFWHWELRSPEMFSTPVPARGKQGLWIYKGKL